MIKSLIIGIDFDNTLISYDDLMHRVAVQRGLIRSDHRKNKKEIRNSIRQLSNGEKEWQKLQATVYGPGIQDACLIDGVTEFLDLAKQQQIKTYIVSHKTEFAAADKAGINLRQWALEWMKNNGFFDTHKTGISRDRVFFENTRQEKIQRIIQQKCTHFIDDLEETFTEERFPTDVVKILFDPHPRQSYLAGVNAFSNWHEIRSYLFSHT